MGLDYTGDVCVNLSNMGARVRDIVNKTEEKK